jgi:dCTP deaminase
MILSDRTLGEIQRRQGAIPLDTHIGPSSADLTLGDEYASIKTDKLADGSQIICLGADVIDYEYKRGISRYLLQPHEFVLATTRETINVPGNMAGYISGRSSVGRAGLQVQNAGFVDAGFKGKITLELYNQAPVPILLEEGTRICQITFHRLDTEAQFPYSKNGKYHDQDGVVGSLMHQD